MKPEQPSKKLWNEVLGNFRIKGQSLPDWCRDNGIKYSNLYKNLTGERNGPKALWWREQVIEFIQDKMITQNNNDARYFELAEKRKERRFN